jgi:hypothetical protein
LQVHGEVVVGLVEMSIQSVPLEEFQRRDETLATLLS